MPEAQIFKATYSGIPVYEMMSKSVAVMRRRVDSWMNATQILKVAGLDKPQRTRVLEREVQKGEHEKVQGGYGKYQGTWIPLERGMELAKQYNCDTVLRPLFDFQAEDASPPLAPKHLVSSSAAASRPPAGARRSEASSITTRSSRKQAKEDAESLSDRESVGQPGSEDGSMTPSPSESSASSRTPSPIPLEPLHSRPQDGRRAGRGRARTQRKDTRHEVPTDGEDDGPPRTNGPEHRDYAEEILEYFISDSNQIPDILIHPPPDFDPNLPIDDDGHTPLHWACAMGRVRILKLLLSAGADIFAVNKSGQTPLMRSVMFSNNYDVRKFPEMYEHLHKSTLNIDNYNRTVFHHIVDLAMSKNKTHAARYYMESILTRLEDYPKELSDIVNFQDEDGETALTLAARCRSKRLVKILIDHSADPKIVNNDGKSAEDYILEDERFRASPGPPSRVANMAYRNLQAAQPPAGALPSGYSYSPFNGDRPPLHHSVTAQRASTRCVNDMATMLDSLAASFDQELRDKDKDITQAHALLGNIQSEILESQRAVGHIKAQADALLPAKTKLKQLEHELKAKMGKMYRVGWEKWIRDEEQREASIRQARGGYLLTPEMLAAKQHPHPHQQAQDQTPAEPQPADPDAMVTDKTLGKRRVDSVEDDVMDLTELYQNLPATPEAIAEATQRLHTEIALQRQRRKDIFDELVTCLAEAGTSSKMNDYRKLLEIGCGGISASEVDDVVANLLESLEEEEPSTSAAAWVG